MEDVKIQVMKGKLLEAVEKRKALSEERRKFLAETPVLTDTGAPNLFRVNGLSSIQSRSGLQAVQVRAALLAYAFLRGRRYWTVERKTKSPVPFAETALAMGITDVRVFADTIQVLKKWTEELPSPEEKEAFEEHLREVSARARSFREAREELRIGP